MVVAVGPPAAPPRWSLPFEHDRGDPFVDLVKAEAEHLPRDLRKGFEHWRDYAGCSASKHRKGRCHHHRHGELLQRFRGQGRGRRGSESNRVELAWKRSESAEHHARFGQHLVLHMDRRSRYVGKPGPGGTVVPYSLEELARDLRRPGEEALPLDVLEDVINAFVAAKLIHRWQGREREEVDGLVTWRGKVAIIRCTHDFLIRSGMAALRDQALRIDERRTRAAERRQAPEELRAVVYSAAQQRTLDRAAEHVRRQVMTEHPEWVRGGLRFAIDAEVDRRLEELERRRREARERRRPPPKML